MEFKTLNDLRKKGVYIKNGMLKNNKRGVSKVLVIRRSSHVQFYMVSGLRQSYHFSLGEKGLQQMKQLCEASNIPLEVHSGTRTTRDRFITHGQGGGTAGDDVFVVSSKTVRIGDDTDQECVRLMSNLARLHFDLLYGVSFHLKFMCINVCPCNTLFLHRNHLK
jgi:hypothetical protein